MVIEPTTGGFAGLGLVVVPFTLSEDNDLVVIDANDIKNTIQLIAYMPDGTPFPAADYNDPDNFDYASDSLKMGIDGWFSDSMVNYDVNCVVMCSDMPLELNVGKTIFYDNPEHELYAAVASISGKFDTDLSYNLPVDLYKDYISNFSLTDADLSTGVNGFQVDIKSFSQSGGGTYGVGRWGYDSKPESVTVHACFPENDFDGNYAALRLGIVNNSNPDTWETEVKYAGVQVYTPQGEMDFDTDSWGMYCADLPDFTKMAVPEKYYTKALFASGNIMQWLNWEDESTIEELGASFDIYGPQNERISGTNPWDYLLRITRNGEEVSVYDVLGSKLEEGDFFAYSFRYDNVLVDESIEASVELTIGFGSSFDYAIDTQEPYLNYYQFRNAKGEVANVVAPEEGGKLYIAAQDNAQYGVTAILREVGGDAEIELTAGAPEETLMGDLYTYDLEGTALVADKWYDLYILVKDEAGNYTEELIGYALKGAESTGVQEVEAFDGNAVYYDLSGRRVLQPAAGIYIKEIRRTDGTALRTKVAVK